MPCQRLPRSLKIHPRSGKPDLQYDQRHCLPLVTSLSFCQTQLFLLLISVIPFFSSICSGRSSRNFCCNCLGLGPCWIKFRSLVQTCILGRPCPVLSFQPCFICFSRGSIDPFLTGVCRLKSCATRDPPCQRRAGGDDKSEELSSCRGPQAWRLRPRDLSPGSRWLHIAPASDSRSHHLRWRRGRRAEDFYEHTPAACNGTKIRRGRRPSVSIRVPRRRCSASGAATWGAAARARGAAPSPPPPRRGPRYVGCPSLLSVSSCEASALTMKSPSTKGFSRRPPQCHG